jgi:malate dehydrogenase (oxaloacetate-decarboxylating)
MSPNSVTVPGTQREHMYEEREDPHSGERYLAVRSRGLALHNDPLLNKGTCFTSEERRAFGLDGLLPHVISTPEEQEARVYGNFLLSSDDIQRYLFLTALQDRNETLFYRLLLDHIEEMAPVVYTPTVGKACESYSHIYRRPRGVFITPRHRGRMRDILLRAPVEDCRIIVCTDNEAILGLGDLGVGGMGIPIGKLTLYAAGAGIHPASCLPIDLDFGTDNQALLDDPLYLGVREPRLRGEAYFSLIDELVEAVREVFPRAVMQWEDFAGENAFQILERYRHRLPSFDDDIQGTAAVVVAGISAAQARVGRTWQDERVVFYGVGAAGGGCARLVRLAMQEAGLSVEDAAGRVLCLDSKGLLLSDRPGLDGHKLELATPPSAIAGWKELGSERIGLLDVVRHFAPTTLVGMSGRAGAFTREIIEAMHAGCPRPFVLPLSNPTSHSEARPTDLLHWTRGAAVVATGSPFPPVQLAGQTYEIGQANNVLAFPGIGLGALAVEADHLPDAVFLAAARTLARCTPGPTHPGSPLFPPLRSLRKISREVALGTARALVDLGAAAPLAEEELQRRIAELVWEPHYLPYRVARGAE